MYHPGGKKHFETAARQTAPLREKKEGKRGRKTLGETTEQRTRGTQRAPGKGDLLDEKIPYYPAPKGEEKGGTGRRLFKVSPNTVGRFLTRKKKKKKKRGTTARVQCATKGTNRESRTLPWYVYPKDTLSVSGGGRFAKKEEGRVVRRPSLKELGVRPKRSRKSEKKRKISSVQRRPCRKKSIQSEKKKPQYDGCEKGPGRKGKKGKISEQTKPQ